MTIVKVVDKDEVDNEQYEDGCYDQIDFNYSYNDCASDLSLCEQNIISLTSVDSEQGVCSQEILNTEESIESLNQIPYSFYDNFPFHIRNIFSYINSPANIKWINIF